LGPQRSLSPRHQPQQPVEEADGAQGAGRDHPQRKAHAPGSRRRAVRQRPPRPRAARRQQPAAEVAVRHAERQAGALPSEPARQARRLLRPLGDRRRPRAEAAPVRAAQEDGARAVQAVHLQQARGARPGSDHQAGQGDGRTAASGSLGRARGSDSRAPGAAQPRADAAPPRHPGLRAGAGRRQGDPHSPAGLHRLQRRLRRRPDGRPHPAVAGSADRGVGADAVEQQHPVAGARRADRDSVAGHRARLLLPDQGEERCQGEGRAFGNAEDVMLALEAGELETLSPIRLRFSGDLQDLTASRDDQDVLHTEVQAVTNKIINTTVGRVILNQSIPAEMPFVNGLLKKKGLQQLVQSCYLRFGLEKTVEMLDSLKNVGFTYATRSGLSIGIDDLIIPKEKAALVTKARDEVIKVESQYLEGAITNGERYNKVIAIWSEATEEIANAMFGEMEAIDKEGRQFNPVYIMADSGARGSKQQIRQLAGMRGLMAKPSGEIIETP